MCFNFDFSSQDHSGRSGAERNSTQAGHKVEHYIFLKKPDFGVSVLSVFKKIDRRRQVHGQRSSGNSHELNTGGFSRLL